MLWTVLVVVALLAVGGWFAWRSVGRASPLSEVGRFSAAREVTNRWSSDPSSTPKPLQDYLIAQGLQPRSQESAGDKAP